MRAGLSKKQNEKKLRQQRVLSVVKQALIAVSLLSAARFFANLKAIPHHSGVRIAQQDFSSGCTNKSR
jgi:hypothetical protein